MMGNGSSQLQGLEVEDQPTEITDFWSHYQATISDSCRYFSLKGDGSVSVFKGEAVLGPLWALSTPLEKFSNNLLKYRHPCIIRYISAWQQRSTFHLATEFVQPVSHILMSQTPLQICIGLNNILRALVFLHDQAGMSHNNVSLSAVYVTGDGQWKLGGLQYLCSFSELTSAYLKHAKIHRYDKAVDPNEESYQITTKVDQYGFAVLVEDVFKGRNDDDVPHLGEFRKYCRDRLQQHDPGKRPQLSEVLQHNFFNHEFISIYKFLNFLPLKTDDEKTEFFRSILTSLKCYDEDTVAKQFCGLLLSRLTMLDATARKDVIPFILKPKNDRLQNGQNTGFFSITVFKEHVKPRLLQLFGVRDSQIRQLLLTHFSKYVHVFSHEELSQHILPELLLGMKDTDDSIVASTLICLSELVPILGADTVIGGHRSKIFTDGRPKPKSNLDLTLPSKALEDNLLIPRKISSENIYLHNRSDTDFSTMSLNVRPSPVGGESGDDNAKDTEIIESEEDWSDWDNSKRILVIEPDKNDSSNQPYNNTELIDDLPSQPQEKNQLTKNHILQKAALEAKKNILDISELDIKSQRFELPRKTAEEFDFFADMTPVIEKPTFANVDPVNKIEDFSSKLNFIPDENECWGDNWDE